MEKVSDESKIILGVCRFNNINGVTCYMNSILHILQQVPLFADYIFTSSFAKIIQNKTFNDEEKIKKFVCYELFRLFSVSMTKDDMTITPTSFRKCIGDKNDIWSENKHQDSQEFLSFLITTLEEEIGQEMDFIPGRLDKINNVKIIGILASMAWKQFQYKEFSPLKEMFNGMSMMITKCNYCSNVNNNFEPFTTLQVAIPIKDVQKEMIKEFTLDECLDELIKEEQLDKNNLCNCDMCGFKNKSHKTYLLWKTPKILVIHLKRFLKNGYNTQKLINNIKYPINDLDLSKYISNDSPDKNNSKYNLVGINFHQEFGFFGTNSGHYTSMVKNRHDNNWYLFNDGIDAKKILKKEDLQNRNAYLLFYYKK